MDFRGLTGRVVLALSLLILLLGGYFIAVTIATTRLHMQATDQSLHADLAASIVAGNWFAPGSILGKNGSQPEFDRLMSINPNAEIYFIDPAGRIAEYSAPSGHVKLTSVNLDPIRKFVAGTVAYPILGDDPREPARPKVFSAAQVIRGDVMAGYVYIVLGGEAYRSVADMYQASYVLRIAVGLMLGGLAFSILIGLMSIRFVTGRLTGLINAMIAFEHDNFARLPTQLRGNRKIDRDEIDKADTAFRRIAQQIIEQIAAIENHDRSRREMVTHVLHDLKTPLSTLHGYLETLVMKWRDLEERSREGYLKSALQLTEQFDRIISELFDLAALEDPEAPIEQEAFSMAELVQDIGQKYRIDAERKNLKFEISILDEAAYAMGDIRLIERMLENLIENAIKFTPSGGSVKAIVDRSKQGIVVRVADSGVGIPADDLPRIFDRFYRGNAPDTTQQKGTGLGLAIAKRIAEIHNGKITAESRISRGTTMSVLLPAATE